MIYKIFGINEFMPNTYVHRYWVYVGYSIYLFSLYIFYIASTRNPGQINLNNIDNLLKKYQYDNINFTKKDCETCKFPKYTI